MRMPRLTTVATAGTLLMGSLLMAPTAADAATYTSSGLRCTKVGGSGANRIVGTPRNDVICGRGGNDTIYGGGGADVIDGGAGNDVIRAGAGNDRVYGGTGRDTLNGDDGADSMNGQWDDDVLVGGTGDDSLAGYTGTDRIDSGAGNDAVTGGAGPDTLAGGAGNDRMSGDDGGDIISGNDGNDVLAGNADNDDLLGGAGSDRIDGGAGTNWCDATSSDSQTACKTDLQAPQAATLSLSRSTVDVSNGPVTITASVRVTDDTGVRQVQIGHVARLTRGTVRDGWWNATITIPQYSEPGLRAVDVSLTDRVGRSGQGFFPERITVVNSRPDRQPPVVRSMSVSPASVDVRAAAEEVTATMRITDDLAGVEGGYLCPAHLYADAFRQADACSSLERTSGTARDGLWTASYTVPRGAVGGQWNFQVWVEDASGNHPTQYYFGPDQLQWEAAHDVEPWGLPLPDGAGRFTVTGSSDNNAPVLTSMTLSPPSVDVRTSSATVTVDLAATDLEGITSAGVSVAGETDQGWIDLGSDSDPTLVSGTPEDGVWRLRLPIAQGTPPGTYRIQVWLEDVTHFTSWLSPGSSTYDSSQQLLTPEQAPTGSVLTVQ
jgi:Ca2+-binding RTX toxin-like protein